MSEKVGFLAVAPRDGAGPLLPGAEPVSEATKELIDAEVRRIVDEELEDVRGCSSDEPRAPRRARRGAARARDARRGSTRTRPPASRASASPRRREPGSLRADRPGARRGRGRRGPDHRGRGAGRGARAGAHRAEGARACRPACGWPRRCSSASTPSCAGTRTPRRASWREAGHCWPSSRAAPARSSPASGWRSTSSAGCPAIATLTARYVAGGRGHRRAHPRHPQDHPGPARAREGGGARRRRRQPPQRALRRDPRQGEPRDAGGRGGGGRAAGAGRRARAG